MKTVRSVSSAIRNRLTAAGSALAIACAFSGTAQAGNVEPVIVEPVVTAPALPSWEGFYLGGKVGYAFNGDDRVGHTDPSGVLLFTPDKLEQSGLNYGLRLGWRGQRAMAERSFVYGVELGYDAGKADDSFASNGYTASVDMNHVLGLRLKSGVTNKAGDTLFYGILGYVRGDFDYAVNRTTGSDTVDLDTSFKTDGFSIGVGVEHLLNDRWSVNAEWEYLEFDSKRLYDGARSSTKATPKYNNVQLGVNFRF